MKELIIIQSELKAPKSQYNSFGKYNYRNCEDILEAVKPLLKENECFLIISDDLINIGDRYYVKSTATIINKDGNSVSVNAFARESENKKGMDDSQITGSTSSYARKYALNGLFLIDDTKDSDSTNTHGKNEEDKKETKSKESNVISESAAINLQSISRMKGFTQEEVYKIIGQLGYTKTKEILKQDYSTIIETIEIGAEAWREWQN